MQYFVLMEKITHSWAISSLATDCRAIINLRKKISIEIVVCDCEILDCDRFFGQFWQHLIALLLFKATNYQKESQKTSQLFRTHILESLSLSLRYPTKSQLQENNLRCLT